MNLRINSWSFPWIKYEDIQVHTTSIGRGFTDIIRILQRFTELLTTNNYFELSNTLQSYKGECKDQKLDLLK
jgi:hypothetical protein